MGVPLTVNDGKAFNAENICDTCDVLLTSSRTRSELLCARKTRSSMIGDLADALLTEDATPFQDTLDDLEWGGQEKLSMSGGRRNNIHSSSADNFTQIFGSLSELQVQVQRLEQQNDWSQVATPYVSCKIGMTYVLFPLSPSPSSFSSGLLLIY
jgi:hypothetical protein